MRIDIVGLPATGKSTLAEAISKKLSIPHIHLDRFWLEAGIRYMPKGSPERVQAEEKMKSQVRELTNQESWVSDGAYFWMQSIIAPRADQIIFLDISIWRRLLNHAQRIWSRDMRHKEVSFWDDIAFFWEVIKRTYTKRKKIQRLFAEYRDKIITLRSYKEIDAYLKNLE